jgi:hypothetical protein
MRLSLLESEARVPSCMSGTQNGTSLILCMHSVMHAEKLHISAQATSVCTWHRHHFCAAGHWVLRSIAAGADSRSVEASQSEGLRAQQPCSQWIASEFLARDRAAERGAATRGVHRATPTAQGLTSRAKGNSNCTFKVTTGLYPDCRRVLPDSHRYSPFFLAAGLASGSPSLMFTSSLGEACKSERVHLIGNPVGL